MIASLPMYATPLTAGADARFWALIRDNLRSERIAAPEALTLAPQDLLAHWQDPALLFSQTCGLPFRAVLKEKVHIIGTPDYGIKGCPPGYYHSVIVARSDDPCKELPAFANARFAYNDPLSQSGWAALALEAPEVLRGPQHCTGSHRASVMAVRQGNADFAAIDAVTWRHLKAASEATGLKIIHATRPTPGLPYITSKKGLSETLFWAVSTAISMLGNADRAALHLKGLIALPPSAYDLPIPPNPDPVGC